MTKVTAALAVAFGLTASAAAHDGPHVAPENAQTAAGVLSKTNNDGPKTASHLRIGIWNTASNITVYHIGASWNDWVLYMLYDKLLEPSPYLSKGRSWLATEVVPVTPDGLGSRILEAISCTQQKPRRHFRPFLVGGGVLGCLAAAAAIVAAFPAAQC